jgi:hypothetical protein
MAHGVKPILPFDITLATFLVLNIATPLATEELLAIHTRQLQRCKADLAAIHANILHSCFDSVQQFEHTFKNTIHDHDFKPGALILVCNSSIETDLGHKTKPRYFGLMVVVRRTPNGTYQLAELDGAISRLHYAAFHLVPYHACSRTSIPVTHLIECEELMKIYCDGDNPDAAEDLRSKDASEGSDM